MKYNKFLAFLIICILISFTVIGCSGGSSSPAPAPAPPAPTPIYTPIQQADTSNKGVIITITKPGNTAIAVLVGVREYPGGNSLNYTVNDADVLRLSLIGSAFWAGSDVTFTQNNDQITKAMIQDAVASAKDNITDDGLFLFMYSGHGASDGDTGYIVPYDGVDDDAKMISEDELQAWLEEFPGTSKKYVLLDSCYSGSFIDKGLENHLGLRAKTIRLKNSNPFYSADKFAKSLVAVPNTYAMTASKGSELSYESGTLQDGVFIYFVCTGLGQGATIGPASTSGTTITANNLAAYAPPLVTAYESTQHPQSYNNSGSDMQVK